MADGEERTTLRPLRPATPPAGDGVDPVGPAKRLPRQRRPSRGSGAPATNAPTAATAPAAATTPAAATETKATEAVTASTEPTPETKATEAVTTSTGPTPDGPVPDGSKPDGSKPVGSTPDGTSPDESTPDGSTPVARRRRVRFAHAVRLPGPRAAARATRDWSRRPSGRLALPGVFLLALVAVTATAGALLVPATLGAPRPVAADASADTTAEAPGGLPPAGTAPPFGDLPPPTATHAPGATPTGLPGGTAPVGGRPSDALAGWAREVGTKIGIDPVAMQAYGYAELVLAETNASCTLSWTTLAAIGLVESRHGQANNARLGADGRAVPEIIGLPLDGQGGRMRIADTDRGEMDGDTTYDRAVGPMQFIPTTWQEIGADADNDGRKDPHNIHDAALAAGMYLCKGGRNLTIPGDWWNAILSYNDVRRYAQEVFDAANRYGQASRT
ncbi:lytic transglycosylase domain-containing protein [Micromonospora phaseoli]|uniref:lytic transglycosylase domain-containing protein n=1 Tax=Micromonospora phaseoli TaxID=1144548 RepID=UPI000B820E42|nr:lytic murein transglycosylase [Micromonospora phaseoli]GIJ75810.1 hypothetical protein Xph01_02420 [Micromonospora phaseoli]